MCVCVCVHYTCLYNFKIQLFHSTIKNYYPNNLHLIHSYRAQTHTHVAIKFFPLLSPFSFSLNFLLFYIFFCFSKMCSVFVAVFLRGELLLNGEKERARENKRERESITHIYTYTYLYIYIHYIYSVRGGKSALFRPTCTHTSILCLYACVCLCLCVWLLLNSVYVIVGYSLSLSLNLSLYVLESTLAY